ncbi:MAG TPA: DUF393 domain-containing protein [Casimicrobiaceae bacterium]|nr:DUF393 domain-containing protein [Casimicrobiaceae bacterium]
MKLEYPLTVYYDASCPLCRAETEALKARDAGDALRLVDCSCADFEGPVDGVTRERMMARIHARDSAGRWIRGMDVFAAVYAAAGLRLLARLFASRALRPLFDRLYPWVADHRRELSRFGLPRPFRLVGRRARGSCAACAPRERPRSSESA